MTNCAIIATFPIPPYVSEICKKLLQRGISHRIFDWSGLDDDDILAPKNYRLLLICNAQNCPAFLKEKVFSYLKLGGNVLTIGGPPFENEFYSINNKEQKTSDLARKLCNGEFDKTVICPFEDKSELADFTLDTTNPDSKKLEQSAFLSIVAGGITGKNRLCWHCDNFYINESFEKPIMIKPNHNVIGFWACGFEQTKTITVELIQKNGDVFKTTISPNVSFTFFMLSKMNFHFAGNQNGVAYTNNARPEYVNFSLVEKIRFGHALSHAYSSAGEQRFYIDELVSGCIDVLDDNSLIIDGLYPPYKFFPVTNAHTVKTYEKQAILKQRSYPVPRDLFSFSKRAQASGIDKARRFRFIPLIESYDDKNMNCGCCAYMLINFSYGDKKSNVDGSIISAFTTSDDNFYENGGDDAVCDTIEFICAPAMLLEGGANEYIYRVDEITARYGAVLLAKRDCDLSAYRLKITIDNLSEIYTLNELLTVKTQGDYSFLCITSERAPSAGTVSVSLLLNDETCDIISHDVLIDSKTPIAQRQFARIKENTNEVFIGDFAVRFFGVNYMPSANISMETFEEFEHYVSTCAYDPDIIEQDLMRLVDIGINAVSIFFHYEPSIHSNNILHLVTLCKKYGLYVVLSIRPHANPYDFNSDEVTKMITKYGFENDDNIVGYDIAWERYVGTYEPCYGNFNGRKMFDEKWRKFILSHYGSYEKASDILGILPTNEKGEVISPSDDALRGLRGEDCVTAAVIAVYRRFIDNEVAIAHIRACDFIRKIESNNISSHLITARSGDASTIPLCDPGIYGYDYKALAMALDCMSPEGYAISDDNLSMRQGVFTNIYSRFANPNTVVQWMEFGKSVWTGSNFTDNHVMLNIQAEYYRKFFDMLLLGHTSGLYAWWFAGGYRVGENSDFGIINPDGSDRPVTAVFREYAKKFINAPPIGSADTLINIDRDLFKNGLMGIYKDIEHPLFAALNDGKNVAFTDDGAGKTSRNVALIEVGNVDLSENIHFVPKYIDALILSCVAILDNGSKNVLQNGDTLNVLKSKAVTFSFEFINSQSALWLCGNEIGSVFLESGQDSVYSFSIPIFADIPKFSRVSFHVTVSCEEKGLLSCQLNAKNRSPFGEKFTIFLN